MQQPGLSVRLQQQRRRVQQQHERLRELGRSVVEALGTPGSTEVPALLDAFRSGLDAHFAMEEEMLFPALHGRGGAFRDELAALVEEHRALRAALVGRPNRARFERILVDIREHERREEDLLERAVS